MQMKDDKFYSDLRNKLSNMEKPVPEDVWASVQRRIGESGSAAASASPEKKDESKHRSLIPLYVSSAVAACIAVVVLVFGPHFMNKGADNAVFESTIVEKEGKAESAVQPNVADNITADKPLLVVHQPKRIAAINVNPGTSETESVDSIAQDVEEDVSESASTNTEKAEQESDKRSQLVAEITYSPTVLEVKPKTGKKDIRLAVYANGLAGNLIAHVRDGMPLGDNIHDNGSDGMGSNPPSAEDTLSNNVKRFGIARTKYLQNKEVIEETHDIPIRIGASVRFNLNKGFSLESGLSYTFLKSSVVLKEAISIGGYNVHTEQQTLHYVGIPLYLSYSFVPSKTWDCYVSLGEETSLLVNCKIGGESVGEHPVLLSVGGRAGVQYNIIPMLAIFAEPGVDYYINTGGQSLHTIYKKNPFVFNIKTGLRLNLSKPKK